MENLPKNTTPMKPVHLAILLAILVLGVVNLLAGLGIIGGNSGGNDGGGWEYRVVTPVEMDSFGFKVIAEEEGIKPDAENKMEIPREKATSEAMLSKALGSLAKEGFEPVSVSLNGLYIFRRAK
ncbi:MAG: hypothetical protein KDN20_00655 [Verrucomicrobiae bacterium]|nr:hypothetical protein [Verrucomicrobiae bacterium]